MIVLLSKSEKRAVEKDGFVVFFLSKLILNECSFNHRTKVF